MINRGTTKLKLLKVEKNGTAEVLNLSDIYLEENLQNCLCIELGTIVREPIIQSDVIEDADLLLFSGEYIDAELTPINEFCQRVLPDDAFADVVYGDAIIALLCKCYGTYKVTELDDSEIDFLCRKMQVQLKNRRAGGECFA